MKHLKIIFRTIFLLSTLLFATQETCAHKEPRESNLQYFDSVEVSLLTCQPHDEVYSLYGHTALRWHDLHEKGDDIAFNWGVFNFNAPYFAARFVLGLTDYELGAYPYRLFLKEYQHFGSMVTEQALNLTASEKADLQRLLADNLRPENIVYRYNYFYNNCTTKARDIIEQCINGKVEYAEIKDHTPSYRDMVHEMTRNHPWARFGNDLLLGVKADQPTDQRQQEFLPHHLMYDFKRARINADGLYRPMVTEERVAVPPGVQTVKSDFPLTPLQFGVILLAVGLVVFGMEWRLRRAFIVWEALLMLTAGAIGTMIFLMLFSQHPTVSLNLQIILFNPIHWIFLWPVIRGRGRRYWPITAVLAALFLIGGLFQSYAEGLWTLALCLLLQCVFHLGTMNSIN